MLLGDLIDLLEKQEPDRVVRFNKISDHDYPGHFCSWRGVYAELSLTHAMHRITAKELLASAREALTKEFYGWKGGDYRMDRRTPVWADDEGDCDYNAIVGVEGWHDGSLGLITANVGDYR